MARPVGWSERSPQVGDRYRPGDVYAALGAWVRAGRPEVRGMTTTKPGKAPGGPEKRRPWSDEAERLAVFTKLMERSPFVTRRVVARLLGERLWHFEALRDVSGAVYEWLGRGNLAFPVVERAAAYCAALALFGAVPSAPRERVPELAALALGTCLDLAKNKAKESREQVASLRSLMSEETKGEARMHRVHARAIPLTPCPACATTGSWNGLECNACGHGKKGMTWAG